MNPKQVHIIFPIDSPEHTYTISDASLSDYLGKPCVTGKALTTKDPHWIQGSTIYIPFDRINTIVVFENEEAWRAGMKLVETPKQPTDKYPAKK